MSTERNTDAYYSKPHERIVGCRGGEPVMNDYLKTIIAAQSLIKQLLNNTTYGKFMLGDITISKPEDLDNNFWVGTLITIGASEWFLTTNSQSLLWQNYSQGVILDSEGLYILILKALEDEMAVELLHKGA